MAREVIANKKTPYLMQS